MLEEGTRGMSQSCMDHEGPVWRFVPEPDETATLGDPIEGNQDGGTGSLTTIPIDFHSTGQVEINHFYASDHNES